MPVDISTLVKLQPLPGLVARDPITGKPGLAGFQAAAVVTEAGVTAETHILDPAIHTSKTTIDASISSAVATAMAALQSGDIATLQTSLTELKTLLNTFINGAADGGTIDRLTELVAAIEANKDNIDALVADKVAKADIIDNLTSDDATKTLSAAQGKALKTLIDSISASVDGMHAHANQTEVLDKLSVAEGKLKFNGGDVGEVRHWSRLITEVPTEWPADMHPSGILFITAAIPAV